MPSLSFDLQPTLVGEQVVVRPLRADDWSAFYAAAADPAIWALHPFHDRWQEPICRALFDAGVSSGGGLAIMARDGDGDQAAAPGMGRLIGSSRYVLAHDQRSVEIGYTFLTRAVWGGSLNRPVKQLMVAHALCFVPEVTFRVGATNARSRRALAKIGARLTDRIDWTPVRGVPTEHVIYAIDREAFVNGPLQQC